MVWVIIHLMVYTKHSNNNSTHSNTTTDCINSSNSNACNNSDNSNNGKNSNADDSRNDSNNSNDIQGYAGVGILVLKLSVPLHRFLVESVSMRP